MSARPTVIVSPSVVARGFARSPRSYAGVPVLGTAIVRIMIKIIIEYHPQQDVQCKTLGVKRFAFAKKDGLAQPAP